MTIDRLTLLVVITALALFFLVLEMVRRRALAERYSLLWLLVSGGVLVLALGRTVLDNIIFMQLGITYPPSALFSAGFVGLIVIMLYMTHVITLLSRQNRTAAQRIGLLEHQLEELKSSLDVTKNE